MIAVLVRLRRPLIVIVHAVLVVATNYASFWLRFDGDIPARFWAVAVSWLPVLLFVRLIGFLPFRLFEGLWKYTSLWDLRNILLSIGASTTVFAIVTTAFVADTPYPRSVYVIDALLLICSMTAIRLLRRTYSEVFRTSAGRRVVIYGAGDAGELIVRDLRQNARHGAQPVGFLDDDPMKRGRRIHGVPVVGARADLGEIIRKLQPEELLIAIPSASRKTLRDILRHLEPFKIRITTLPRMHELIGSRVDVDQIRQLRVEDLLAREPIGLDYAPVREYLKGKRVMVTGAGGSIGSELCRQIAVAQPSALLLVERSENALFQIHNELRDADSTGIELVAVMADVTDASRLEQVFSETRPQLVFHAAAHKHVPLMESNPCEAVKNNVRGTRLVAQAAARAQVERFILISTDKAVNPTSVMGSTKRVAELLVASLSREHATRFAAVRFGNVLASNGSVVPTFMAQIARGGPVTVTHPDIKRYFMLIPEAVQLVLHAGALADPAPLFILDMGEQVKVADLARDLIRLSGHIPDKDIEIKFTGLRPGEKMFEELVGEGEVAEPSLLDKILRVEEPSRQDFTGFEAAVDHLEQLAAAERSEEVLRELKQILLLHGSSPRREVSAV